MHTYFSIIHFIIHLRSRAWAWVNSSCVFPSLLWCIRLSLDSIGTKTWLATQHSNAGCSVGMESVNEADSECPQWRLVWCFLQTTALLHCHKSKFVAGARTRYPRDRDNLTGTGSSFWSSENRFTRLRIRRPKTFGRIAPRSMTPSWRSRGWRPISSNRSTPKVCRKFCS